MCMLKVLYIIHVYCIYNLDNDDISLSANEERGIATGSYAVIYENDDDFGHIEPTPWHS